MSVGEWTALLALLTVLLTGAAALILALSGVLRSSMSALTATVGLIKAVKAAIRELRSDRDEQPPGGDAAPAPEEYGGDLFDDLLYEEDFLDERAS